MKKTTNLIVTMMFLFVTTASVVLYSDGWRINSLADALNPTSKKESTPVVIKTGMLAVRSVPQGAKVYLNNEAVTATDDTISSLPAGKYKLRVAKEGFETWEKDVEVLPELVTDITAVLVLKSPRLEPLTNTDVRAFALSSNGNNIAYLTKNHEKPGIWILPLTGTPLNIFRNDSSLLVADTPLIAPSLGDSIEWSPNDKEIAVRMNKSGYLIYKLSDQTRTIIKPIQTTNIGKIREKWQEQWKETFFKKKMENIITEYSPPSWLVDSAMNNETTWSPDDQKFFYISEDDKNPNLYNVLVYNAEKPLPVGEKRINLPLKITKPDLTKVYWYSDSYHLIVVERESNETDYYTVSLVRIDGTNKTTIYTGYLASSQAYATPGGDKIIVMTSLKENSPNNLYAISIR